MSRASQTGNSSRPPTPWCHRSTSEGPCVESYRRGERELWPDLDRRSVGGAGRHVRGGWGFACSVFAFPVPNGPSPVGVLEDLPRHTGVTLTCRGGVGAACAAAVGHILRAALDRFLCASDPADSAGSAIGDDGFRDQSSRRSSSMSPECSRSSLPSSQIKHWLGCALTAMPNGRSVSEVAADIVARELFLRDQCGGGRTGRPGADPLFRPHPVWGGLPSGSASASDAGQSAVPATTEEVPDRRKDSR